MTKIGIYKIETSFNITGRGIVALCRQVEGAIKIGAITDINFKEKVLRATIIGYERGKIGKDEILRCGLCLKFDDMSNIEEIINQKLSEQIIEIFALESPLS